MIIFINGSLNSGKTTIAKLLKSKIPNTAHIEVDDLRGMIDWMPLKESIPLNLENAISLMKNFSNSKINCVVSYPLSQKDYEFVINSFKEEFIYFFTLSPCLDTILSNRGSRDLSDWEIKRIKLHYESGMNDPGFGIIIDNSNQTPEETLNEIISYLDAN